MEANSNGKFRALKLNDRDSDGPSDDEGRTDIEEGDLTKKHVVDAAD